MLIRLVANAVFWLNAFPHADGVSDTLSPRYLLIGQHLDYRKHVRLEIGSYVQTHEEHTNDMLPRTIGAICLGPSGNEQRGHYFLSLMTGRQLLCDRWTDLPLPQDAITRVGNLGRQQGMPKTLTFADHYGFEIADADDDIDDDHDSDHDPANDDASAASTSSSSSHPNDDSNNDDDDRGDGIAQPLLGLTAGVDNNHSDSSNSDDDSDDDDDDDDDDSNHNDGDDVNTDKADEMIDDDTNGNNEEGDENHTDKDNTIIPKINIPDTVVSTPLAAAPSKSTGVGGDNAGVGEGADGRNAVMGTHDGTLNAQNAGVSSGIVLEESRTHDAINQITQTKNERYGARQHGINLRDPKTRNYDHLYDSDHLLTTFDEPMGELFMTEQMSLKKILKYFGKNGADAVVAEMQQLDYRNVIKPMDGKKLTREQKRHALQYLMYLKQK
jgi:hypothetical protein